MSDIFSLLNIESSIFSNFALQAALVDDLQTGKVVNKNVSRLKEIKENKTVDNGLKVSPQSIDAVINKVKLYAKNNNPSLENWTLRELRIVSYYLMKFRGNTEAYNFALRLLDNSWKNLFFNGLSFYLLSSWNSLEPEYRESTCKLMRKKLNEYHEDSKRYLLMKDHGNFFEKSGPMRMAALLSAKQLQITDAPTIIGYKSSTIDQSYYSDVILNYVENCQISDLDTIESILEHHNLDRTKKLLFAYLVENEGGDPMRRIQLCRFVNRKLGDISIATTWAPFVGATYNEAQRLKHAMDVVNIWFAQQIIESFFEICVQDKDRKIFWLKYVEQISGFKIIGSAATKRLLQSNNKIGNMFLHHFIETNSTLSQTAALVLFMKNKMLVEFSDTGCLYVYNQNHDMVKLVTKPTNTIASINDLKIPSMPMLIEIYEWANYYNSEGRLVHKGNWQDRLSGWMRDKIQKNHAKCTVFANQKDDNLFQATPLPEETKTTIDNKKDTSQLSLFENSENTQGINQEELNDRHYNVTLEDKNSNEVIYENDVDFFLRSKRFFDDLEVVANRKGFYVTNSKRIKFAFLKELDKGKFAVGNIWIKNAKMNDWCEIVHFHYGTEVTIGFLKKVGDLVYYKTAMNAPDKKQINLK